MNTDATPFADRLIAAIRQKRSPIVVGLDPRWSQLPPALRAEFAEPGLLAQARGFEKFCREVIDVVAPLVPAVKPQAAFFEQLGPQGMMALGNVVAYAREKGLLVILDGKRNDIGTTAQAYAEAYLGANSPWGSDSLTVSPYLGDDSLQPFADVCAKTGGGIFVLVKTSNPGGRTFQDLPVEGEPLYRKVATLVESLAVGSRGKETYGAVGAVVGATYPEQLQELRTAMPHSLFLVPGYGAQGGGAKDVAAAFDAQGLGAVVNNSRGIIFAYEQPVYRGQPDWQRAVEAATRDMQAQLQTETSVGRL